MNLLNYLILPCLLYYNVNPVESYRILMICPAPSPSHQMLCNSFVDTLVDNANQVTYISTYPSKNTNIKKIVIPFDSIVNETIDNAFEISNKSGLDILYSFSEFQNKMAEMLFTNKKVKKLLNDKTKEFDAVIYEYMMNEMTTGFGVRFNCPVIILSPDLVPWIALMVNNPLSLEIVPNPMGVTFSQPTTLYERTMNTIMYLMQHIMGKIFIERIQRNLYSKYMPEEANLVPYDELHTKISMVTINTHPSIDLARPLLPNIIEIAGFHIGVPEPLPEDLQNILDSAENGVIYFSLGSIIKSSQMKMEIKQFMLKTFSTRKETILWKFEEDLPEKPDNVVIKNWMPQLSILAHRNVKLFITHGGLLSTLEGIHFGVPMLAIPVFGDQPYNAKRIVERSQGVALPYETINEENFTRSINEILENPIYAQNAKKIKELFRSRPMKPRDLLAFSVNHVITTKGAKHLASPPLCRGSLLLLDVAAVILIPIIIVVYLFIYGCKKVCRRSKNCQTKKKNE